MVFFAETFGDLILPEAAEGMCSRTKPLEKGHDYLAAPTYMLQGDERQRRRTKDHSKGCLQVTDQIWWHGFDPYAASTSCVCVTGEICKTISRLGAKEITSRSSHDLAPVDVFETFCDGAAIIGGPNVLRKRLAAQDSDGDLQGPTTKSQKSLKGKAVAFLSREI
jgi:hypothetical protein